MKSKILLLVFMVLTGGRTLAQKHLVLIPYKSTVYWKCDKHNGIIPLKRGDIHLHNDGTAEGAIYIDAQRLEVKDLDSLHYKTGKMILENTLKNEFLELKKYPETVFFPSEMQKTGKNKYLIRGDLFMHGQKVCIEFPAELKEKNGFTELISPVFVIDRTDWGIYRMSPSRPYPDEENGWTVPDQVEIRLKLTFAGKN